MNTTQLCRSIARHLNVSDSTNLDSDALFDVVTAINSGLHLFFTEAPSNLKKTTFSAMFRAPISMSLNFTAQYANTVMGTPFDSSWYGCGVKIQGAPQINEIISPSSILDSWMLPTLQAEAQILFDAQPIPVSIERIVSDVRAYTDDSPDGKIISRDDSKTHRRNNLLSWNNPSRIQRYRIEPTAINQGGSTSGILRVYPAPLVDTIVRFEAEISAASVTAADVMTGSALPIADAWVPLLIPLCEEALTYSPLWRDPMTKNDIRKNAANVIAGRIKKLANDLGVPNNSVGTPWRY